MDRIDKLQTALDIEKQLANSDASSVWIGREGAVGPEWSGLTYAECTGSSNVAAARANTIALSRNLLEELLDVARASRQLFTNDTCVSAEWQKRMQTLQDAVEKLNRASPVSSLVVPPSPAPDIAADARNVAAQNAYELYEFGEGVTVTGHTGWDVSDKNDWTRVVNVEFDEIADDRVSFHVRFKAGSNDIDEVYGLLMSNGTNIGYCAAADPLQITVPVGLPDNSAAKRPVPR